MLYRVLVTLLHLRSCFRYGGSIFLHNMSRLLLSTLIFQHPNSMQAKELLNSFTAFWNTNRVSGRFHAQKLLKLVYIRTLIRLDLKYLISGAVATFAVYDKLKINCTSWSPPYPTRHTRYTSNTNWYSHSLAHEMLMNKDIKQLSNYLLWNEEWTDVARFSLLFYTQQSVCKTSNRHFTFL